MSSLEAVAVAQAVTTAPEVARAVSKLPLWISTKDLTPWRLAEGARAANQGAVPGILPVAVPAGSPVSHPMVVVVATTTRPVRRVVLVAVGRQRETHMQDVPALKGKVTRVAMDINAAALTEVLVVAAALEALV